MKKRLCYWIFKKELEEAYKYLNSMYIQEMNKVKVSMEYNKKQYGLIKRIFKLFPTAEIIGIEKNKKDEELLIVLQSDSIFLFGERYQGICGLPRILFDIKAEQEDGIERKYIYIEDIIMEDNNIGNGTVAMNALISYAKKNKFKYIYGWLSPVDNDHADRRDFYYKKFGFSIKDSHIYLEL